MNFDILAFSANHERMDAKDYQIIDALQQDGRLSNQDLSAKVALSPSPCLRRVRLLEEAGIIAGYTAVVDQKRLGLSVTAFVQVKLERHGDAAVKQFEEAIERLSNVMDCWLMTGEADYLLRVVAKDLDDFEGFIRSHLQKIPGIASISSSFAYGRVKRSRVLPLC